MALPSRSGIMRASDQLWALSVLWVSPSVLSPEERPVLWLLHRPEYARLVAMLVAVRHAAGVRQQKLAKKLGKPQSFVAQYEGGERRIDLVEFIAIARPWMPTRRSYSGTL
jgi:Helix-turn-helix